MTTGGGGGGRLENGGLQGQRKGRTVGFKQGQCAVAPLQ